MARQILMTAALPYANGDIHLGHLVEYIQADIWARFQRIRGNQCYYFCADDTHGTAIMIRARQEQTTPEAWIETMHAKHQRDFAGFDVAFDHYYSTHSEENRKLSELIFGRLKAGGWIETREVMQTFCEHDGMWLPDRYVRGTCPRCGAEDQYGDSCEACGATYQPAELANPHCSMCSGTPVLRPSDHYFFKLSAWQDRLRQYADSGSLQPQVVNKLNEWFKTGLKDWDITRDAPYFGFLIPGETKKYFYVWLDAPVGYMASARNYMDRHGLNFDDFWAADSNVQTEVHHFIGKDILYFHTLFWPAMLMGAGFRTPTRVNVHGFLTVNGAKMSKSRGTFINAATYLQHLDPQYLRYYYAAKLSGGVEDVDLNLDDFVHRVNAELVGKLANLTSRSAGMLNKRLDSRLGSLPARAEGLLSELHNAAAPIADLYERREYAAVIREVCRLADQANRYAEQYAPWTMIKDDPEQAREDLTGMLNAARTLTVYLKPVLPRFADKIERLFGGDPLTWPDAGGTIQTQSIGPFERLVERIDPDHLAAVVEESKTVPNRE